MNILVAGTGHVGTTMALVFAEMGWNVTGLDTDQAKMNQLQSGSVPFYEPGLTELLHKHLRLGNIRFTIDADKAINEHDVIFICVGTPSNPDGSVDMRAMAQLAGNIGRSMNGYKLIVNKSTVPIGTEQQVANWVRAAQETPYPFDVASNPEFLREGKALEDAMYPARIVIGASSESAIQLLKQIYAPFNSPIVVTTPRTAEMIKYAANAFLATKISYMNELAGLCDKLDINVKDVAYGIGLDSRIGEHFLQAGIGYGGSCFPKDIAALLRIAKEQEATLSLLKQAEYVNQVQYLLLLDKVRTRLGSMEGRKIALLGLAFKPDTDDIREAPAIRIIRSLLSEHAEVYVHDPAAKLPPEFTGSSVTLCPTPEQAMQDADAVLLCTEWQLYRQIDWRQMKKLLKEPNLFDGRNMLDAAEMKQIGYYYQGIGYA